MEDILQPRTEYDSMIYSHLYIQNEIFSQGPIEGTTIINNEKLASFLETLQKQVYETQTQVISCVSESLYRQEIQERYELTRKMDSTLLDINYLREYIYYHGNSKTLQKDKTQFILGEIENLKMMMKRIEKQQYEGLDLFRRLKKTENHIVTLAKLMNERIDKEKLLTLKIEELQNQMNQFQNQVEFNQQATEKKFTDHNDRLTDIELTLEEEEEEQEHSISETRSIMRSMSFSIGDIEEDLRRKLHPLNEEDDYEETEEKFEFNSRAVSNDYEESSIQKENTTSAVTAVHSNEAAVIASTTAVTVSNDDKVASVSQERTNTPILRKSVVFEESKPLVNVDLYEKQMDKSHPSTENEESKSRISQNVVAATSDPIPEHKKSVILVSGKVADASEYPEGRLLKPVMTRSNTIKSKQSGSRNPSFASSSPRNQSQPQYVAIPQKISFSQPSSRRPSRFLVKQKTKLFNSEILDFLKTQYFEKLQNVEFQSFQLQKKMLHYDEKLHQMNLNHLKKILFVFSNAYSKQLKQTAFQKILNYKLSYDRRKRETVIRNCTIFIQRLLRTDLKLHFKKWRKNCLRLKKGEKMKLWLATHIERWYERVKPNIQQYLNRWKIFTIVTYRESVFTGDEDDADAIRNANNQYFLTLQQTLLKKADFNLEELKQQALQDLKARWTSADRKAKDEARYQQFQDRMIVFMNEYFDGKLLTEQKRMATQLQQLEKDMVFAKKDLSRALVLIDDIDRVLAEKSEATINKALTHLNNFKSQYTVQITTVSDAFEKRFQLVDKVFQEVHNQLQIFREMKESYESETLVTIATHANQIELLQQQHQQHDETFQQLHNENRTKDQTISTIQDIIGFNQKALEKANKLLESHVDESNQFFSEEILWIKNLCKNFHQSFQDFKVIYDQYTTKTNRTIDVILSGETSQEQYQKLLKNVCHYYKQFEFYKLIGIQQVSLSAEIEQLIQLQQQQELSLSVNPSTNPNPLQTTNLPPNGQLLQKKLKLLNEIKEKYSQQFIHEQRKKISDELSETARRLAFYIVVKSDNYVTSYFILNQILKLNHQYKLDAQYEQPPSIHHPLRPHSASFSNNKSKSSQLPVKSPERNRTSSPPGKTRMNGKQYYSFDDNETTNQKLMKQSLQLYTFNNENLSIQSIRKQYLTKIKEELETKLSSKDEQQLQKSHNHQNHLRDSNLKNSDQNISDFITITTNNLPIIKEIREKFLIQFFNIIERILVACPKIPFFHGVNSFLRTNSIFPHPNAMMGEHQHYPDMKSCIACNRPLLEDWDAVNQYQQTAKRPKSASHISSTYHHKDPFQDVFGNNRKSPVQQFIGRGNTSSFMMKEGAFMPITLSASFAPAPQHINSTESYSLNDSFRVGTADSIESLNPADTKQNPPGIIPSTSKSKSKSKSTDFHSITYSNSQEMILEESVKGKTKLSIVLKPLKRESSDRSPSPSSQKRSPTQRFLHDRLVSDYTVHSTLSPQVGEPTNVALNTNVIESYSQVQANPTVPTPTDENMISFLAEATIPQLTSEMLVDTLAYQFPKEASILPKHLADAFSETNKPQQSISTRKLFGKDQV